MIPDVFKLPPDDETAADALALLRRWRDSYHRVQVLLAEHDPAGADDRLFLDADTLRYIEGKA